MEGRPVVAIVGGKPMHELEVGEAHVVEDGAWLQGGNARCADG